MILVTGGTGYIGTVLVQDLLDLGHTVRVVDTQWFGNQLRPADRLEVLKGDLRYCQEAWLNDITSVLHLAGFSNDPTADLAPELNSACNVMATRALAQLVARRATMEGRQIPFIFASTCSVYYSSTRTLDVNVQQMTEDLPVAPSSNYSKTKRLAEIELLRLADRNPDFCPVILRKGTIFGVSPRMRFDLVVNTFVLDAWRHRTLTVHGQGEVWRPLLHIRDAVDAYVYLLGTPLASLRGEIFNLVHKNYRILELAHWVAEVLEQQRNTPVHVKRDRSGTNGNRSYYVSGRKIAERLGFRAERGTTETILAIWDGLERGDYGSNPAEEPAYFNILALKSGLSAAAAS
jgi:nucleoside-diphosphate-sugar epimerase